MAEDAPPLPPPPPPEAPRSDEPPIDVFTCPHCQQQVAVDAAEPHPFITCPYCGGEFAVATPDVSATDADEPAPSDEELREEELNGIRIKQIAAVRRAAIRGISYLWVGVVSCLAVVGGLIQKTYQRITIERAWDVRTFAFIAGATAALAVASYFYRNIRHLKDELSRPLLDEPTAPPDFSTLSDGSQQWKNLDDVK